MLRRVLFIIIVGVAGSLVAGSSAQARPCWRPPVDGVVADPFREPPCPYCAGNRGIEYRIGGRTSVSAVESGTVTWSGEIAGTRYVVVRHANGWRATYGRLSAAGPGTGDVVLAGTTIGSATTSFYFGLREGDRYIDPMPYLGRLVGRPRLVPTDGTAPRPAPPARWSCESTRPFASRVPAR
ncbi:murein hydrolase activator EnvC family protein [Ilumatobacter nonamiensis]|uniref:murein hydrolase activator EnvC family protein n=1 Tax=Ilumatobacter nonamiensis TaxID=467093 RepID=UPI00034AEDC5|nr:M23 family metallopeptidase [Ilumatobacter nonamiensis]